MQTQFRVFNGGKKPKTPMTLQTKTLITMFSGGSLSLVLGIAAENRLFNAPLSFSIAATLTVLATPAVIMALNMDEH